MKIVMDRAITDAVKDYRYMSLRLQHELQGADYIDEGDIRMREYLTAITFPVQVVSRIFGYDFWGVDDHQKGLPI